MKLLAIILAGFAAAASAGTDTDYPHRDWGQVATLDMPAADAIACVARTLDREGSALIIPTDGGSDIDYSAGTMFGGSVNDSWARYKVRQTGADTTLRVLYRHPLNQKWLRRVMRKLQSTCLKVKNITPV